MRKILAVWCKEYLSCMILQVSDNNRFYQLKTNLENSMTMGQDNFSMTIVETQCLLNNYQTPPRQQFMKDLDNERVALMQSGDHSAPPPIRSIKCWHCRKKGHYKSKCPKLQMQELEVGIQNLSINNCKDVHSQFSASICWVMIQDKEKEKRGVRGISWSTRCTLTCVQYTCSPRSKSISLNIE